RRLLDFMDEYRLTDLEALATVIQNRSESAMREAIRRVPDGVYASEIENDGMGERHRFPIQITVRGDEIDVDFAGAPPQVSRGGHLLRTRPRRPLLQRPSLPGRRSGRLGAR